MFIAWKRDDGYISSSKRNDMQVFPDTWADHRHTYTTLGKFSDDEWAMARDLIKTERLGSTCPFCKTTHWADKCPPEKS